MASPIDEIFIKLGFKTDDKDIDKTKKKANDLLNTVDKKSKKADVSFGNVLKTIRNITVALGASYVAFDRLANAMLKNNQAFVNFNRQTGLALSSISRLAGAGMLIDYNLTPENIMSGMQAVESNLAQIRLGEGNIAPFQMLGISPVGKNAVQVIEDLREAIKGIDDMTAVNLIQQMGLSPEFITLLRMSKEEMDEYSAIAQQYMLSPEQRQAMQQYAMGLRLVHLQLNYLKDTLVLKFMPVFINFARNFNMMLEQVFKFVDGLQMILDKIPALKVGLGALATFILARFNPILAAITALYLLLEDFAVWLAGGKSVMGKMFGDKPLNLDKENFDEKHPFKSAFNMAKENPVFKMLTTPLLNPVFTPNDLIRNPLSQAINNRNVTQNNYITTKELIPQKTATSLINIMNTQMQIDTSF